MPRALIIRGFGKKRDSRGREYDFDRVQQALIAPAIERCGLSGGTTQLVRLGIQVADLVVKDISSRPLLD